MYIIPISTLFKHFTLLFISLLTSKRLLGLNKKDWNYNVASLILCTFNSILFILLPSSYIFFYYIVAFLCQFYIIFIFFKANILTTLKINIISIAISYSICLLSVTFTSICFTHILNVFTCIAELITLITCFFQYILFHYIFKIKRIKNGIPSISNDNNPLPLYLCFVIIFCYFSIHLRDLRYENILFVVLMYIFLILLFFWLRDYIKNKYLKNVMIRNIHQLEEEIAVLKDDNAALSSLIHKDNKLIPALMMSVEKSLMNNDEQSKKDLLQQLSRLMDERQKSIHYQKSDTQSLAKTGVTSIDSLIEYMYNKALRTQFDFSFSESDLESEFLSIVESCLPLNELSVILADLLDNAMIATSSNGGNAMKLSISVHDSKNLYIDVYDTGAVFSDEVLLHLGRKRITTHEEGSGIGLTTIYKVARKHLASMIIDETISENSNENISENPSHSHICYTKKISILFDKQNRYLFYGNSNYHSEKVLSKRLDLFYTLK